MKKKANIKKIKSFVKSNDFLITNITYFIISLLFSIISLKTISLNKYYNYNSWIYISLSFIILSIIILIGYKKYFKTKQIEKIFLMIVMPLGMLFLIYLLPYYVPDEEAHMLRAYDISQGNFITKRNGENEAIIKAPKDFTKFKTNLSSYYSLEKLIYDKTNYNDVVETTSGAVGYFPILYIFSSIGMLVGRILNLNLIITIYLARILNFTFFIISGYYIIKKLPFGKTLGLIYMLSPMMLQQMTSVSADCVVNIVTLVFITTILNYKCNNYEINNRRLALILVLILLISLCKYVYLPLVLLLFLLDKKELKKIWKKVVVAGLITIGLLLLWMSLTQYKSQSEYVIQNNVNPGEQLESIIKNPLNYIDVLHNTSIIKTESYIFTFVGRNLGWLNIIGNNIFIVLYIFLLIASVYVEKHNFQLTKKEKIISILTLMISANLIILGMYLSWTTVGGDCVEGVQGRYFIPILILLFISMADKEKYLKFKNINLIYVIAIIMINYTSFKSIFNFFLQLY